MSEIKYGDKIYIIVRSDLSSGAKAVQGAHALTDFILKHIELAKTWREQSDHLAFLEIENEEKLKELLQKAQEKNIAWASFHESDMNDELTAIALGPANKTKKLCYHLKLALKNE